jgi:hypothetical protein
LQSASKPNEIKPQAMKVWPDIARTHRECANPQETTPLTEPEPQIRHRLAEIIQGQSGHPEPWALGRADDVLAALSAERDALRARVGELEAEKAEKARMDWERPLLSQLQSETARAEAAEAERDKLNSLTDVLATMCDALKAEVAEAALCSGRCARRNSDRPK